MPSKTDPSGNYDAIVIGAGPCGSAAAYYLANGMDGFSGKKVALLDKASFPRDKFCGDAWCSPALDILEDMSVLQKLESEGLVQDCTSGGFVSPSGESFVSTGEGEPLPDARCYAIKRIICDERIARRAAEVGADLFEQAEFKTATLEDDGLWTVHCQDGRVFRGAMLIAADGATSAVARSLGVVNTPPEGVASRQYVKGGTHNFKSGGVLLYPSYVIPGYVAIFRHYNDDIDIGCYVVPGGAIEPEALGQVCKKELLEDPFMQRVLGPNPEFLERPRVASLRTGGVEQSTAKQFMAVGDAAGQTDPLTGEGIHTGMIGGKLAAQRIHEMASNKDFSAEACAVYHKRWMDAFGKDFPASAGGAKLTYKYPLMLDAANIVAQKKGDAFMADFGAAMTGVKSKTTFLRPGMAIPLGVEVTRQFLKQAFNPDYPSISAAYAARAREKSSRPTAFANACLIDSSIEAGESAQTAALNNAFHDMFQYAGSNPNAQRIMVMYGSEYGFAKEVAELCCKALANIADIALSPRFSPRFSPRCINAEDFELIDWRETHSCLLICSTAGDGVPPLAAKALFAQLENEGPDLSYVHHATLALGDSAYPNFCRAGHTLDKLFTNCGSQSMLPVTEVNKEDMNTIETWINDTITTLSSEDYQAVLLAETSPAETNSDELLTRAETYFSTRATAPPQASEKQPFIATVVGKKTLSNTEQDGVETVHIDIDVSSDQSGNVSELSWQPGDALGVLASNAPDEVDAVLACLSQKDNVDITLPADNATYCLKTALSDKLDIKKLKPSLLEILLQHCSDEGEHKRLEALRNNTSDYLANYELQDVLAEFPASAKQLKSQALVNSLNRIKPRYYSVASSQLTNKNTLSLCVAVVRYQLDGRDRTGLASTFLADRITDGDSIRVFVQNNPQFRLPPSNKKSACVMIGAGTGVAPYRAFMQELNYRAEQQNCSLLQQSTDRQHLLFFGCRHENADFLYADTWKQWAQSQGLGLFTAFSRDQTEKIYVQHRLREQAELLWQRMESGDYFYICGDASAMAHDVEQALLQIIIQQGQRSDSEATGYLEQMMKTGRLQKDVWAV